MIVKQNRWFSLTMKSYFMPLLAIFLQKLNFLNSKPFIFGSNGRTKLIFDSGKICGCKFFKKWKLEKGGANNYAWVYIMTISKNANLTSETSIRASYHRINDRNQHSGMMPPLLHPLSYSDLQSRNRELFPFLKLGSYVHEHPETSAPLLVYFESSTSPLQFMYVSFFLKMLCFRCTDPFPKNELDLLLWLKFMKPEQTKILYVFLLTVKVSKFTFLIFFGPSNC